MLREDEADPRQLRVNVTSPGGTTEAALDVLMGDTGGLVDLMRRATQAPQHVPVSWPKSERKARSKAMARTDYTAA